MLHTWCCFSNVRDGTLMIGLYTLITRITAFIIASFCSANVGKVKLVLGYPFSHIDIEHMRSTFLWIGLFSLILAGASVALLYGSLKEKHFFIIPWLSGMVLDLLGNSVIVILCGIGVASKAPVGGVICGMLAIIVLYAFNVYCVLCVLSHYENLKHRALIAQFSSHSQRMPSISESLQGLVVEEEQPSPSLSSSRLRLNNNENRNRPIAMSRITSNTTQTGVEIHV